MKRTPLFALLTLTLVACDRGPSQAPPAAAKAPTAPAPATAAAPQRYPLAAVPDDLLPHVAGPTAAIKQLQGALGKRVMSEMKAGGPTRAITVCQEEALAITAELAKETGIDIGRTAAKLRNPKNAPPPWLQAYVVETANKKAAEVEPMVFDLGDRVAVVRAIGTAGMCTTCHGAANAIDPEIQKTLATAYADDQAVGFAAGDLRGLFWAVGEK